MSKRITGRATIHIDGASIPHENGATLNPGGSSKTVERHGGVTYYSEQEVAPSLELNVLHTADVDIVKLSNIRDATVLFEADTGQKYLLSGATSQEPVPLESASGKSRLMMFANSCVPV